MLSLDIFPTYIAPFIPPNLTPYSLHTFPPHTISSDLILHPLHSSLHHFTFLICFFSPQLHTMLTTYLPTWYYTPYISFNTSLPSYSVSSYLNLIPHSLHTFRLDTILSLLLLTPPCLLTLFFLTPTSYHIHYISSKLILHPPPHILPLSHFILLLTLPIPLPYTLCMFF